jgi:hypothetical protein
MDMIRPYKNLHRDSVATAVPRPKFIGAFLLASGLSAFLIVAMTGFTLAMTMVWPG